MANLADRVDNNGERIARLEAQMDGNAAIVEDIKLSLRRLSNKFWTVIVLLLANLLAKFVPNVRAALE